MNNYDAWKLATPPHYDDARCVCGCAMEDHFEPDMYDMGNAEAAENGKLNYCGDCADCYAPEEAWCCDAGPMGHAGRHWKEE